MIDYSCKDDLYIKDGDRPHPEKVEPVPAHNLPERKIAMQTVPQTPEKVHVVASVSRETGPKPEYVCPWCHRSGCRGECGGRRSAAVARPEQHLSIREDSRGRWNWQRWTPGLCWTSRESYPTALAAAIDAVHIARCYGVAVVLPRELRPAVATHFRNEGAAKFLAGQMQDDCLNAFERLGWTLAKLAAGRNPSPALPAGREGVAV